MSTCHIIRFCRIVPINFWKKIMFDIDKFIECIHEKVALWDKSRKEYSDKILREKSWMEIGEMFYNNWLELDAQEKDEKVKEMKNKWRHIRDNFLKFLNKGKSGDPAPKMKKYIYADALQFLLNTVEKRKTSGNIVSKEKDDNEEKENENVDDKEQREQNTSKLKTQSSQSTTQRNLTPFQRELLKKLDKDANNEEDADRSFLLSLLPDYKKLNDEEKLDFRLTSLQFFKNCQQKKNIQQINSYTGAYFQPTMAVNDPQIDASYPINPSFHFQPPPPSSSSSQRLSPTETFSQSFYKNEFLH